jgi:Domain of unknown function (DUF4956)
MTWLETILQSDSGGGDLVTPLLVLLVSFVVGQGIGWVYMWTHKGLSYSQTFVASLVVIPVIVSLVMLLMAGNIAIAFGLLAVFAVVRFRNVLKDTRDTTFILWSIVEGLAIGTKNLPIGVLGAVCVAGIFAYLRVTSFGRRHRYDAVLSLQLVGDLAAGLSTLKHILKRHSMRTELASERRLTDQGLDLSYRLLLRDPTRSIQLQLELESTDGIDHVALYMREDESEI